VILGFERVQQRGIRLLTVIALFYTFDVVKLGRGEQLTPQK
jgi:hypothetical protein